MMFLFVFVALVGYFTVISSSHLVVGREESFCRFMCHDLAPSPWA
jgi:hypothetical protein